MQVWRLEKYQSPDLACSSSGVGLPDETVLGEVTAVAKLAMGMERLKLIFTGERMIVAHVGKRGGGSAPLSSLIGLLAGGLEDLFKGGRESVRKRKMGAATPQEILESDSDNFSILYGDIVRMELSESEGRTRILLLSKDDKFQFLSGTSIGRLKEMVGNALGDKLSTNRTSA